MSIASKGVIAPGECGFLFCNAPRLGGVWKEGGSWLCDMHSEQLLHIRAIFDEVSPRAVSFRESVTEEELHPDANGFYKHRRNQRATVRRGPTCCRPGCDNERLALESYCPVCQSQGHTEDD